MESIQPVTYKYIYKHSLRLVNKNPTLLLINSLFACLSFTGLYLLLQIPEYLLFKAQGSGMAEQVNMSTLLHSSSHHWETVVLAGLLYTSLLFLYISFTSMLGLYLLGGTCGTIGRGIGNSGRPFTLTFFFQESRRLFFPLSGLIMRITVLLFMAVILIIFYFFAITRLEETIVMIYSNHTFIKNFTSLFSFTFMLILIMATTSVATFALTALFVKKTTPAKAFNDSLTFVLKTPSVLLFTCLTGSGYIIAGVTIFLMATLTMNTIFSDTLGEILLPLIIFTAESYLALFVLNCFGAFYAYKSSISQVSE